MVPFGGWDMPVQYAGVKAEHTAVRGAAGLFDVSHMGEVSVRGPGALDLVQRLTPNDASRLEAGRIQYSALTTEAGTFVDDILVYCRTPEHYLLVVNASNTAKDVAWIQERAGDVDVRDESADWAQIAIQGPNATAIAAPLAPDVDLQTIGYYRFVETAVAGIGGCILSRTGYTGEDGFEVYLAAAEAAALWRRLLEVGAGHGLQPCGLGARDTLRLEAKLALYGNDIDDSTTVIEAGLGWIVRPNKGDFLGRDVLAAQKADGAARRLIGFEMTDRGIARHGYPVRVAGKPSGTVTSGTHSPTLSKAIGLAYVPSESAQAGTELEIEIRGRATAARIVDTPFVPHNTLAAQARRA